MENREILVGFVPRPDYDRDTFDIIWSCLLTIVACVWASLHINIHSGSSMWNKVGHCYKCIVGPDAYAGHAIKRLVECLSLRNKVRALPGEKWNKLTLKQCFTVRLRGIHIQEWNPEAQIFELRLLEASDQPRALSIDEFLAYARNGSLLLADLPSNEQICNRSKADWIAKTVAAWQVVRFAVNIIIRLSSHRDIALLETVTAAYVACGLVMYGCLYDCPQDVQEVWEVRLRELTDRALLTDQTDDNEGFDQGTPQANDDGGLDLATSGAKLTWKGSFYVQLLWLGVFMGVHLAAWSYQFPSLIEAWIWRSACVTLSIGAVFLWPVYGASTGFEGAPRWQQIAANGVAAPAYIVARITLLVLAFANFRAASRGIYDHAFCI